MHETDFQGIGKDKIFFIWLAYILSKEMFNVDCVSDVIYKSNFLVIAE